MDINLIYNEDCVETMSKHIKPNSIDIIITTPPCKLSRRKSDDYSKSMYNNEEEYCKWTCNIFNDFNDILKENGVILYNFTYSSDTPSLPYKMIALIEENTDLRLVDTIIWKKKNGLPFPANKYRLSRICEFVFVFSHKDNMNNYSNNRQIKSISKTTGQTYYDVFYNMIDTAMIDDEPNRSDLIIRLLNIYCNLDSKRSIYDPFMGNGTTAIACAKYDEGENKIVFYGSEKSYNDFKNAETNIKNARIKYSHRQLSLFEMDKL